MKLLVTGATGLIGKKIIDIAKERNIEVHFLSTRKDKLIDSGALKGFYWNPQKDEIDDGCFEGVDTLIHLAGASISKRWTTKNKKEIIRDQVNNIYDFRKFTFCNFYSIYSWTENVYFQR